MSIKSKISSRERLGALVVGLVGIAVIALGVVADSCTRRKVTDTPRVVYTSSLDTAAVEPLKKKEKHKKERKKKERKQKKEGKKKSANNGAAGSPRDFLNEPVGE